jgi:hypothetical protein
MTGGILGKDPWEWSGLCSNERIRLSAPGWWRNNLSSVFSEKGTALEIWPVRTALLAVFLLSR